MNWFQNFVSLWSETVKFSYFQIKMKLWIGFKILYLCGLKQYLQKHTIILNVVNWFQNFVSLWSETVSLIKLSFILSLWIGFKILYLCGLKQCIICVRATPLCCELVSKFCIFVVWNSNTVITHNLQTVVNWFQNFVSLWSETVIFWSEKSKIGCELVSKFCIFVVWNSYHLTI